MKYLPKITKQQWSKLTPAQQRIAIAEDVIARINSKNIEPRTGAYINFNMIKEETSAKDFFNTQSCEACARGAMFMSFVGVNNDIQLQADTDNISFIDHAYKEDEINYLSDKENETIIELFGEEQIALIETAFEGAPSGKFEDYWYENHITVSAELEEFREDYDSTEATLIVIMQNIIDNKGTFEI